jgi:Fic-DOC domain mobile mystery protein B
MGLDLDYTGGQTPLDEDEKEGLLIPTIATREELDEFEQQNIEQAILWTLRRSMKTETILSEDFIKSMHWRMYCNVWIWAGEFRKTNKKIGVDKWQIPVELRSLLDDVKFWHANNVYSPDECTIRFKHRLVRIHCFPNGNGRHSRLMADIVINKIFKQTVYTWGSGSMAKHGEQRTHYLKSIKAADNGDFLPLILFART